MRERYQRASKIPIEESMAVIEQEVEQHMAWLAQVRAERNAQRVATALAAREAEARAEVARAMHAATERERQRRRRQQERT